MKKQICSVCFLVIACILVCIPSQNNAKAAEMISPPTETTINGIPESQYSNIQPRGVLVGPIFYSYSPTRYVTNNRFKDIGTYSHYNRGPIAEPMRMDVTSSTSQGSEWRGEVSFTTEIRAGILGKLDASAGVGHKQTRVANEAVGAYGQVTVPVGYTGHIQFWYKGRNTGGTLKYYFYNTENPSQRYYTEKAIGATVHTKALEYSSEGWVTKGGL